MDAVDKWREAIPEESRVESVAGVALVGAGIAAVLMALAARRRGFLAFALPGALIAAGVVMLTDVGFDARSERIGEAAEAIEAELSSLDPIARAQVLKSVGESQVRSLLPGRG